MTFLEMLQLAAIKNHSMLCVGLDPDISKFPLSMRGDRSRIFDFCAEIVNQTSDLVAAYKPQIAYFAAERAEEQLERLIRHIRDVAPDIPVILDFKRGDIGPTAEQYAREAFERYGADAVTLSPFMGFDSIEPYLRREGKGAFLLCRTSNPGGNTLQSKDIETPHEKMKLYEYIAKLANDDWNTNGQLGLVVGATYPQELSRVRELAPKLPLLIPGIGAQCGDIDATVKAGLREKAPIIVNSSRQVLYASSGSDFAIQARLVAQETRKALENAKQ